MADQYQNTVSDSEFKCPRCGRIIGHLIEHPKHPDLKLLNLGNLNIAQSFHGNCGVCGTGLHFDWRWELAVQILDMKPI